MASEMLSYLVREQNKTSQTRTYTFYTTDIGDVRNGHIVSIRTGLKSKLCSRLICRYPYHFSRQQQHYIRVRCEETSYVQPYIISML